MTTNESEPVEEPTPHVHRWPFDEQTQEETVHVRRVRWCVECGRTELRDEFGKWHRYVTADDLDFITRVLEWYETEAKVVHRNMLAVNPQALTASLRVFSIDNGGRAEAALRVLNREEVIVYAKPTPKPRPERQAQSGNDRRSAASMRVSSDEPGALDDDGEG